MPNNFTCRLRLFFCFACILFALPSTTVATPCAAPRFHALRTLDLQQGAYATRSFTADLNNDGKPDLVTVPFGLDGNNLEINVLLGTGNYGGFLPVRIVTTSGSPKDFQFSDFNNDGKVDFLIAHHTHVEVRLGNGDATFQPAIFLQGNGSAGWTGAVAGDFDGNGTVDVVAAQVGYPPGPIYLYRNTGGGTFAPPTTILSNASGSYSIIKQADINRDAKSDLIFLDETPRVMYGNGTGGFSQPQTFSSITGYRLKIIDINQDTHPDLVHVGETTQVAFNNGSGGFGAPVESSLGPSIHANDIADFNGDSHLDIAAFVPTNNSVQIFLGNSQGNFVYANSHTTPWYSSSLTAADFNGDAKSDLALSVYDYNVAHTFINSCGDNSPLINIVGTVRTEQNTALYANLTLTTPHLGTSTGIQYGDGSFEFRDLPAAGSYTLTPTHSLYDFFPQSITFDNPTSNQTINFVGTIRKFKIYGQIFFNGTTTPVPNVSINVTGGPNNINRTVQTDNEGRYEVNGLLPNGMNDPYLMRIESPLIWLPVSLHYIRYLGYDRQMNMYGSRRQYTVTTRILAPDGTPRPNIPVYRANSIYPVFTDNNGEVAFPNQLAGLSHTFTPIAPHFRFEPATATVGYLTGDTTVTLRSGFRPPADFDGDGKTDAAVFRSQSGSWFINASATNGFQAMQFGTNEDIPVTGWYDADSLNDVAVYRPSTGMWYVWHSATQTFHSHFFGAPEDIPVPADFDRDGKTDFAVFRPSTGTWYAFLSYYQVIESFQWGQAGDKPLTGDWDGNGYTDYAVYRPSTGIWHIKTFGGGIFNVFYGNATDKPLIGDWDGDAKTDICVWREAEGMWFVRLSSNGATQATFFGQTGDLPLAGDFDGDGKTDISVFRPTNGFWYTKRSSNGVIDARQWGLADDIPVMKNPVR